MSFGFANIGHAFAVIAHDVVVGAKKVEQVLTKLGGSETIVESVTALVDPAAVPIERAAYHLLGAALQAVSSADAAASASGVNIPLDAQAYADLKALAVEMKGKLAALGIKL